MATESATQSALAPGLLIVSDDPGLRRTVELMSIESGALPVSFQGGASACRYVCRHPGRLAAALIDSVRSADAGLPLLELATRVLPGLRVAYLHRRPLAREAASLLAGCRGIPQHWPCREGDAALRSLVGRLLLVGARASQPATRASVSRW